MREGGKNVFWFLLFSGLCAFAISMAYRWMERGGAFDLEAVRVRGIRKADSAAVCEAVRPLFGVSIWRVDTDSLRDALVMLQGIDSARVRREPFDTLVLELVISKPSFAVDLDGKITVISRSGEELPGDRFMSDSLPVLKAMIPVEPGIFGQLSAWFDSVAAGKAGMNFVFTGTGLTVVLKNGDRVLLGKERLLGRWKDYTLLSSSMSMGPERYEVDMRFSGQAILRADPVSRAAGGER